MEFSTTYNLKLARVMAHQVGTLIEKHMESVRLKSARPIPDVFEIPGVLRLENVRYFTSLSCDSGDIGHELYPWHDPHHPIDPRIYLRPNEDFMLLSFEVVQEITTL